MEVAEELFADEANLIFTGGRDTNLVDSIGACVFAKPVFYTQQNSVPQVVKDCLKKVVSANSTVRVIGGKMAVGQDADKEIKDIVYGATGTLYAQAGTFGPAEGTETITGNAYITADGVTLRNLIITGDLVIDESVGNGDVTLKNVTVQGNTEVRGGGKNSVVFSNCTLQGTVTVEKADGQIRVVAEGTTSVAKIVIQSGASLVSNKGGYFEQVELPEGLSENTEVMLTGNFVLVKIASAKTKVEVGRDTSIADLILTKSASRTKVNLGKNARVDKIIANASVEVTGQGNIGKAEIKADGVTIEQTPTEVAVDPGLKADIGGEEISGTEQTGGGGGGGGGGGTPTQPEIAVSPLSKNYYAAGETLSFTISGLALNEEVEMSMLIDLGTGGGYPYADDEPVDLSESMVEQQGKHKSSWFGYTDEYGRLTVTGTVNSNLPYGKLWITLPNYGHYIDDAIQLQDNAGTPVCVGEISITDEQIVAAAIGLVEDEDPIASLEVAGGAGGDIEDKEAAVEAYLAALEGMDALDVDSITVVWNDTDGKFDVTIKKGTAEENTQVEVEAWVDLD